MHCLQVVASGTSWPQPKRRAARCDADETNREVVMSKMRKYPQLEELVQQARDGKVEPLLRFLYDDPELRPLAGFIDDLWRHQRSYRKRAPNAFEQGPRKIAGFSRARLDWLREQLPEYYVRRGQELPPGKRLPKGTIELVIEDIEALLVEEGLLDGIDPKKLNHQSILDAVKRGTKKTKNRGVG